MTATAFVGVQGPAAVAGFGIGSRLEYFLIPLAYGFGGPLIAMVGTCIGAGRRDRALRVAWTGAAMAGVLAETVGILGALFPVAWLSIFGADPLMIETGTRYLHIVGPAYGFFGAGMALYFASQGAGTLTWPLTAGLTRLTIAAGGGWLALRLGYGIDGVFVALAAALATFGAINAAAIYGGAWFKARQVPAAAE
jgi:Na+-driven multidrug efflux pump